MFLPTVIVGILTNFPPTTFFVDDNFEADHDDENNHGRDHDRLPSRSPTCHHHRLFSAVDAPDRASLWHHRLRPVDFFLDANQALRVFGF